MLHARETGEGQLVDVALVDSIVLLCEIAVYRYCYRRGHWAAGNSHPHLVPFDNYPTKDGACAIVALTDNHWKKGITDLQSDAMWKMYHLWYAKPGRRADPETSRQAAYIICSVPYSVIWFVPS